MPLLLLCSRPPYMTRLATPPQLQPQLPVRIGHFSFKDNILADCRVS